MKEMKRILVVMVAVLMVSPVLFAASGPTTDGATWGGKSASGPPIVLEGATWGGNAKSGPPILTEGATWGSESIETPTQQGAYHQRIIDLMKSLGRGLVNLVEGATWG